jgi:hypothetical protein
LLSPDPATDSATVERQLEQRFGRVARLLHGGKVHTPVGARLRLPASDPSGTRGMLLDEASWAIPAIPRGQPPELRGVEATDYLLSYTLSWSRSPKGVNAYERAFLILDKVA